MSKERLTTQQAYRAMVYFLEKEYQYDKGLGGLLGSISWDVWKDRGPNDPGAWEDWLEAVHKALVTDHDLPQLGPSA